MTKITYRQAPTLTEIEKIYQIYAERFPQTFSYTCSGKTLQNLPVWRCTVTDNNIADDDKESVFLLSTHAGQEKSGVTTLLKVLKWLLSDDSLAKQIRRKQIITLVPCVNPEGYKKLGHGNSAGGDPYQEYNLEGPTNIDRCPEAKIICDILDQIKPEVVFDVHGLPFDEKYWMLENSGEAFSFMFCRPFHNDIMMEMNKAAEQLGYPMHHAEKDNELYPSTSLTNFSRHFMGRGDLVNFAVYAYNKYHCLAFPAEVCWEESGLTRTKKLLEYGNTIYPTEHDPGYPCRVVRSSCTYQVCAYGNNAVARRKSRCELWAKADFMSMSFLAPQRIGRQMMAVGIGPGANFFTKLSISPQELLEHLKTKSSYDTEGLKVFFDGIESSVFVTQPETPEDDKSCRQSGWVNLAKRSLESYEKIKYGMALKMWLPFDNVQINQIRYNGKLMQQSHQFGYHSWTARNYTFVQLYIPANEISDINIFSVDYSADHHRNAGLSFEEMLET